MRQQAALGEFVFSPYKDSAYESLTRNSDGGWVTTDRAGQQPGSQNTGQGLDTIVITGSVIGPTGQSLLQQLRALQATRQPQTLVDGSGFYHGLWKIMNIQERQSEIIDDGNSLKTTFTLNLEAMAE